MFQECSGNRLERSHFPGPWRHFSPEREKAVQGVAGRDRNRRNVAKKTCARFRGRGSDPFPAGSKPGGRRKSSGGVGFRYRVRARTTVRFGFRSCREFGTNNTSDFSDVQRCASSHSTGQKPTARGYRPKKDPSCLPKFFKVNICTFCTNFYFIEFIWIFKN
jgi:hypothetical protein